VVFSNAVLFQAGTPLYKQIPGTEYTWHEVAVLIAPDGDHRLAQARLLAAVGDGKFLLHGFRNKDLREMLFEAPADSPREKNRRSGQITRQIRMLRLHGLIRKVSGTHRYLVTDAGRQVITALQAAREADVMKLAKAA